MMNPMLLALAKMLGIDANTLATFQNLIATYNANQEAILAAVQRIEARLHALDNQFPALVNDIAGTRPAQPGASADIHPSD